MIPISRPDIGPAEEEAVLEVLRSGMLAMGRKTAAFEEAWAAYCGVKHAVLMSNGTVAQEAILQALGVGPGDEVITVSFSFNATVSVILRAGATPVFVDVRADDFCMDPALVEAAITPRTKAIMPVHLYGLMADMILVEIAGRHGLRSSRTPCRPGAATAEGLARPAMFSLTPEEPDDRRGGFATTDTRRCRLPAALPQPRDAGPLPPRRAGHELADRPGGSHRPRPARAPRRADGDPAGERRISSSTSAATTAPAVPAGRDHVWHEFVMHFLGEQRSSMAIERGSTPIYYRAHPPTNPPAGPCPGGRPALPGD
jgi:hypothetical protein